ncbi:MAG: T9SS type A sorting domain-containing protein [Bacteroidota bacterium]
MSESANFTIAEPCHENWSAMTPTEKGRFCAVCAKCVVDLTDKQPNEIHEIYAANGGDVCGRMRASQICLPSGRQTDNEPWTRRALSRLQVFAIALLATFSFVTASAQITGRLVKGKMIQVPVTTRIEGRVVWEHGAAVAGAEVELWRESKRVATAVTNDAGEFVFAAQASADCELRARFGHYAQNRVEIKRHQLGDPVRIVLFDEPVEGEMDIVLPEPTVPETKAAPQEPIFVGQMAVIPSREYSAVRCSIAPSELSGAEETWAEQVENSPERGSSPESSSVSGQEVGKVEFAVLGEMAMTVYPNPTVDWVTVRTDLPKARVVRLFVYNLQGQPLAAHRWKTGKSPEFEIDLSAYPAGVYLLRMFADDAFVEKRLIKQ